MRGGVAQKKREQKIVYLANRMSNRSRAAYGVAQISWRRSKKPCKTKLRSCGVMGSVGGIHQQTFMLPGLDTKKVHDIEDLIARMCTSRLAATRGLWTLPPGSTIYNAALCAMNARYEASPYGLGWRQKTRRVGEILFM